MGADWADFRGLRAYDDVSAVAAFPDLDFALFEDFCCFDVLEECTVAFFMRFFDGGDHAELLGEGGEAFGFGGLGEAFVHVRPFVVFTVCGSLQVLCGVADAFEFLEPHLGVFLFVVGGFQEQCGDLFKAVFFGAACEVGVLVACLGFAGECGLQVLFGLSASVFVCHNNSFG